MDNFLRCFCDHDYTALIISGTASSQELYEAWVLILNEYHELKGDTVESMDQWGLSRDAFRLRNHLFLVQQCLDVLSFRYSESVADSLRKLGYSFRPQEKDPNKYRDLLSFIATKARTKYIQLRQLIKEIDDRNKKIEPNKKPTHAYFEKLLIQIEEMQGATYIFETTTVSKFVTLEKKYWQQVDAYQEAKANAQNR